MMTRVMVILPFYGGSLPVGRYCIDALREIGCLVDVFESPSFYSAFLALKELGVRQERLEYLENSYLRVVGEAILAQAERFQPDLVLSMAQAPVGINVLKRFKNDNITTAMWFVEDYRLFTYWRAFAPHYDIFAVIQREPFLQELAVSGVPNSLYLPMAAQPSVHKQLEPTAAEQKFFGSDLSFMGAGYPNRCQAFRQLTGYDFKIWGTEWEDEPSLAPFWQLPGKRISSEDTVKIFNSSKINLNLHSSVWREPAVTHGDFVNPRTFEIAACGSFQLVDRRSLMGELFEDDELAVFENMDELNTKISYYLDNPEERAAIARRGQERVLKDHTYAARMKTLLEFVAARIPNWPPSRDSQMNELLAEVPEELRPQVADLLKDLELPPATDFDTLIAALRSRSGKLTHLESALLFLDEWKKQYLKAGS